MIAGHDPFTLGVRSAWRKTVTLAFRTHVGASCATVGKGLSIVDETRMHSAAKISAVLSMGNAGSNRECLGVNARAAP